MTRAFIAMPFAQKFFPVYKAIRAACEQLGITTVRIDEVWAKDDIYQEIEKEILKADFIIADFTGDRMLDVPNPNVVHEAAFARTHKKYLLLMAQDHKCLPFDWRTRPAIIYQDSEEGLGYLKDRLLLGIQALLQKVDSASGALPAPIPALQSASYSPNTVFQGAGPFEVMQNLLQSRQGNVAPIIPSDVNLPPGFRQSGSKVVCEIDGSEMVRIEAAKFSMGGKDDDDQMPVHEVHLTVYLMDIAPVTNAQYDKFVEMGGYHHQGYWDPQGWSWKCRAKIEKPKFFDDPELGRPDHPVVGVSWHEAMAYASWCGKHLPSEAQWEYAARGQSGRSYPWGNEKPDSRLANYKGKCDGPTPVGKFKGTSPFGCQDMAGNVWEWIYDWYGEEYYSESPSYNPIGSSPGEDKVCRGGSWTYGADTLTAYYRFYGSLTLRDRGYGFRCARIL